MCVAAGMPNITGNFGGFYKDTGLTNGTFAWAGANHVIGSGGNYGDKINFDASRSSSIYGASNTVQPPALVLLPQIRY